VEVTCWLRHTSVQRILCHTYWRKDQHIVIPGWPYSVICALEPSRSSWTAPLDARRLAPGEDAAEVTPAQVRQVVTGLVDVGQWRPGDPDILVIFDAGYDAPRLAFLLADLPVAVLGRMRSDRVLRRAAPLSAPTPRSPTTIPAAPAMMLLYDFDSSLSTPATITAGTSVPASQGEPAGRGPGPDVRAGRLASSAGRPCTPAPPGPLSEALRNSSHLCTQPARVGAHPGRLSS
jgi:hypothetical protein